MTAPFPDLRTAARLLGGDIDKDGQIICPGPRPQPARTARFGSSPTRASRAASRSLASLVTTGTPASDYVADRLGLDRWKPARDRRATSSSAWMLARADAGERPTAPTATATPPRSPGSSPSTSTTTRTASLTPRCSGTSRRSSGSSTGTAQAGAGASTRGRRSPTACPRCWGDRATSPSSSARARRTPMLSRRSGFVATSASRRGREVDGGPERVVQGPDRPHPRRQRRARPQARPPGGGEPSRDRGRGPDRRAARPAREGRRVGLA